MFGCIGDYPCCVIPSAMSSACSKTVSVAKACISGGYPNLLRSYFKTKYNLNLRI